jgi:hypothetical protein
MLGQVETRQQYGSGLYFKLTINNMDEIIEIATLNYSDNRSHQSLKQLQ